MSTATHFESAPKVMHFGKNRAGADVAAPARFSATLVECCGARIGRYHAVRERCNTATLLFTVVIVHTQQIRGGRTVIGRDSSTLPIDHLGVSGEHVALDFDDRRGLVTAETFAPTAFVRSGSVFELGAGERLVDVFDGNCIWLVPGAVEFRVDVSPLTPTPTPPPGCVAEAGLRLERVRDAAVDVAVAANVELPPLVAVLVMLFDCDTFDHLCRHKAPVVGGGGGRVSVWQARSTHCTMRLLEQALVGAPIASPIVRELFADIDAVEASAVVFDFDFCTTRDAGDFAAAFGYWTETTTAHELIARLLQRRFTVAVSDHSARSLISTWNEALFGGACPFALVGSSDDAFELRFDRQTLAQSSCAQLRAVGQLCVDGCATIRAPACAFGLARGGSAKGVTATTATTSVWSNRASYMPTMVAETRANNTRSDVQLMAITAMPQYSDKNFEQMRVEDYAKANGDGKALVAGTSLTTFVAQPITEYGSFATASSMAALKPTLGATDVGARFAVDVLSIVTNVGSSQRRWSEAFPAAASAVDASRIGEVGGLVGHATVKFAGGGTICVSAGRWRELSHLATDERNLFDALARQFGAATSASLRAEYDVSSVDRRAKLQLAFAVEVIARTMPTIALPPRSSTSVTDDDDSSTASQRLTAAILQAAETFGTKPTAAAMPESSVATASNRSATARETLSADDCDNCDVTIDPVILERELRRTGVL